MIGLREDFDSLPEGVTPAVAPRLTERLFAADGWLCSEHHLEHRPGQASMATTVAASLVDDVPQLIEAGTGVGKSLAYLLPGIMHAVDQKRQLIVSTHTISLQEQLEKKDVPFCRKVFQSVPELRPYADFQATVLVGKSNYLCTTRLATALKDRATLFADADFDDLSRIAAWAEKSENGIRHELNPPPRPEVWEAICADSSSCSRKYCDCERCFYQKARGRLRGSHVIIVNHALLFALINAGGAKANGATADTPGVLFPGDQVVLDEAHTVPNVATNHFGLSISSYSVGRTLKYLYNPRTKKGLLARLGDAVDQQLVLDALEAGEQFFGEIEQRLLTKQAIARLREPDIAEPFLDGPITALEKVLRKLSDRLEEGPKRDELLSKAQQLRGLRGGISEWLNLALDTHVYWGERSGRRTTIVHLRSAPIDVAPELAKHLFGCGTSVVCTSATLAMGGGLETMAARLGAIEARRRMEPSPFNYARNMRVYVAEDIPLPNRENQRLATDALIDWIRFATLRVAGGTLVLFTSYHDLRTVAGALERDFHRAGRELLLQGADLSRTQLADRMRTLGNGVLFGTDSFWTGVDVPGPALSQVIIARLPFEVPTHPILEARADFIREQGGNPFNELTLPDALIKFRQGIGRLIRSQDDCGLITLLDARVLARGYGKLFLDALPTDQIERISLRDRAARFASYSASGA